MALTTPPLMTPQKAIFCDVDGTLLVAGVINVALVDKLRKYVARGYRVTLWSMRGKAYCDWVVATYGLSGVFSSTSDKPGLIIDDEDRGWCRYVLHTTPEKFTQSKNV